MEQVLRFASESGLAAYDLEQPVSDSFLYLLNTINELDKQFTSLEYELTKAKWRSGTVDITNMTIKMQQLARITKHISEIMEKKVILRAHIQQQFTSQNRLPLDRSVQQTFKEMVVGLTDLVNNFQSYSEAIKQAPLFSLEDNSMELGLTGITAVYDKCQRYHQSLTAVASTISKMQPP